MNKQLISCHNFFGVLSRLCPGQGLQHLLITGVSAGNAVNAVVRSRVLPGPAVMLFVHELGDAAHDFVTCELYFMAFREAVHITVL